VELTDRANGDELGQRHAGEEGVMGRPDAEKRSNRYGFTDSRDDVNLAVHRDVPFSAVREVGIMLRGMGLTTARLVVQTEHDYGTIGLAIGPGQCTTAAGPQEVAILGESLALRLEITERGFVLGGSGGTLGPGCGSLGDDTLGPSAPLRPDASTCTDDRGYPTSADRTRRASDGLGPPPCAFDVSALRQCIQRIRSEYPDERGIIVSAGSTIDFQTLVQALDVVRGGRAESDGSSFGFIGLGFDDVFLFLGDDARRTCAPSAAPTPAGLGMPPEGGSGPIGLGSLGTIGTEAHGVGGSGFGRLPPAIGVGTAEVRGSLSREVIRRSIRRHINEVRFCYEQGLARNPELAGRVSIRFIISPSGAVTSSTVAESTLGDRTAEDCVARAVQRVAFPEPEGGGVVIVTYPFVFNPAAP
jgi:TonB family protein